MQYLQNLKEIISDSWFQLDDHSESHCLFATRKNGCTYNERASAKDITEAEKLKVKILSQIDDVEVDVDVVDEWVHLNVSMKKEKVYTYKYWLSIFVPEKNNWMRWGCAYDSIEEVMEDVSNDLKEKLDSMEFNREGQYGYEATDYLLVCKREEEGCYKENIYLQRYRKSC